MTMRATAFVMLLLVPTFPAYADDTQIYACQGESSVGFTKDITSKTPDKIIFGKFYPPKFIIKYSPGIAVIDITIETGAKISIDLSNCGEENSKNGTVDVVYSCSNSRVVFTLNPQTLQFVIAYAGNFSNNKRSFSSPYISYGICTKF